MESKGLILLTDQVCSMKRDRVNLEDRVLNDIRSLGVESSIIARRLECSDTGDALSVVRMNDIYLSTLRKNTEYCRAYVLVGNIEKNTGGSRFWFSQYLRSINEEFDLLGIDVCFVFTELRDGYKHYKKIIEKDYTTKNIESYSVRSHSSWQDVSYKELKLFCDRNSTELIESVLNCPKYWNIPTKESIKKLSEKIATDFITYGDL